MFLSFYRVIKFSIQDIFRNIWLSLVTIIIMVLALFSVNMVLVVKAIGETAMNAVKEKIDINLYLQAGAGEESIIALKEEISKFGEVKEVVYISKDQALEKFSQKHQNNEQIMKALEELGRNPLTPSLVIKPKSLSDFDNLINKLNTLESDIIESRDFADYKTIMAKINSITQKVSEAGIILSSIFIFITILVIYNTVRVAIYTHRTEIMIMRLVGASKWFIQMPYIISSVIYTLVSVIILMVLFYFFLNVLQPYLEVFFVGYNIDIISYFYGNIFKVFGIEFLAAVLINICATIFAVRKYSHV